MLKKLIISSFLCFFCFSSYSQTIRFVFVGDAMAHGQLQKDMASLEKGFLELVSTIKQPLVEADLAHVNVETAVGVPKTDSEKDRLVAKERWGVNTPYSGFPYFNVHPQYLDSLKDVGFDVFQLSNNHSLDRKARGVDITQTQLSQRNMLWYGTRKKDSSEFPSIRVPVLKNGKTFFVAYISCSFSTNGNPDYEKRVPLCFDEDSKTLLDEIKHQKHDLKTDIVVFTPHWGDEYSRVANRPQIDLAKKAAEAGADLIVGTHPHVLQEYKMITVQGDKNVPVFYSLGNFFNWSINKEGTTSSVIVQIDMEYLNGKFTPKKVTAIPIAANNKRISKLHQRALIFVEKDDLAWKKEIKSIEKSIPKNILLYMD